MSTEWARKKAVEELTLQNLTDAEAVRLLELATAGEYDTDDNARTMARCLRGDATAHLMDNPIAADGIGQYSICKENTYRWGSNT